MKNELSGFDVMRECIPYIYKYGGYMTPDVIEKILTIPGFGIQLVNQLKEEMIVWELFSKNLYIKDAQETLWCEVVDFDQLPQTPATVWHGWVYVLECGNYIKIGHTTELKARIKSLSNQLRNYSNIQAGRVIFTQQHTNHKENESKLHALFANYRKGKSEIFNIAYDKFVQNIPTLEYQDDSNVKEKESKNVAKFFAELLFNKNVE